MQKLEEELLNIKYTMYIVFNSIRIIFQHFLNKASFRHFVCSNSYTKIFHNFSAQRCRVFPQRCGGNVYLEAVYISPRMLLRKVEDNTADSNCNSGRSPNILRQNIMEILADKNPALLRILLQTLRSINEDFLHVKTTKTTSSS